MPKKYTNNLNNDDDEEKKSSGGYASEYIARRNGTSSGVSSGGYASQYIASKTQKRDSSKKQNTSDIRDAWRHQQESNGLYGAAQYYARSQQKQEREKFSSSDWFPFGSYSATFKRDEGTDLANRMRLSSAWEKAKEARKTEKKEEVPLFDETRTIRNPFSTEETPSESRGLFKLIGTPEERKYQYGVSEPSLKKPETIYDTHDFTLKRQEKEEEPADPELYNKLTVAAMSQPDFGRGSIKSNGSRDANSEYANRVLERIARGDAVDWESVPENVRNTIRAREMLEADPNLIDANAAGGSQYDPMHYWSSANEAERAVINYLSNTGQNEKLDEYISALGPVLQKRSTEEWEANVAEAVSSSPLAWLGGTAVGIMESPLRGVSYLHQVADYADDKKINEYADYNRFARLPNTITRAVSQKIAEEFPNVKFGMYDGPNNLLTGEEQNRAAFAYQTLESMGEFAYNAFLSGSFAGGFGKASGTEAAKNASEALVLSIMGTGAAATAVIESKERGLDDTQAFALGTIAGLAEVVTEKVSLEVLLNPNLSQGELMYIIKNTLAEGSEEVASDLINFVADTIISGEQSELLQRTRELQAKGMPEKQAFGLAVAEKARETGMSGLGGAISGGLMATSGTAVNWTNFQNAQKEYADSLGMSVEQLNALKDIASEADPEVQKTLLTAWEKDVESGNASLKDAATRRAWEEFAKENPGMAEMAKRGADVIQTENGIKNVIDSLGIDVSDAGVKAITDAYDGKQDVTTYAQDSAYMYMLGRAGRLTLDEALKRVNGNIPGNALENAYRAGSIDNRADIETRNANLKKAQFETIRNSNESGNGIRGVDEILTFNEAVEKAGGVKAFDKEGAPMSVSQVENALYNGDITVYSVGDLADGKMAYTSELEAVNAADGAEVVATTVPTESVAWLDATQGQYTGGGNGKRNLLLHGSSQRSDVQSAGKQTGRMAEGTGQAAESRRGQFQPKDSGITDQNFNGKEVSAVTFGLDKGTEKSTARLWSGELTDTMKTAKKLLEKRGLKAVFFVGDNLSVGSGKSNVRGAYDAKNGTVYVRADHALYDSLRIAKHEAFHDVIAKETRADRKTHIDNMWGELSRIIDNDDTMDAILDLYGQAYSFMDEYDLKEEILADFYAGLNAFENAGRWAHFADAVESVLSQARPFEELVNEGYAEGQGENRGAQTKHSEEALGVEVISAGMTDEQRERILRGKEFFNAPSYAGQAEGQIRNLSEKLNSREKSLIKAALRQAASELGMPKELFNDDMELVAYISNGSLNESAQKQITDSAQLVKLIPVLQDAVKNAVGIEVHDNRYFADYNTLYFANLLGGYMDGDYFVPVRFGIKVTADGHNVLYVVISDQKINKAEVLMPPNPNEFGKNGTRSAKVNIASLALAVKHPDILKYIPDGMLTEKQKSQKWEAIANTAEYTNQKNDQKYKSYLEKHDLGNAGRMVKAAAKANGYVLSAYHGTGEYFNTFKMGHEGIHLGNIDQASQVAKSRYDMRAKETQYPWSYVKKHLPMVGSEQRIQLVKQLKDAPMFYEIDDFSGDENNDADLIAYGDKIDKMTDYDPTYNLSTYDRKVGENVMSLYAKIANPFVINGDIGDWTPSNIAGVLLERADGVETRRRWSDDTEYSIGGSPFALNDAQKADLQRVAQYQVTKDATWDILANVFGELGYDGIKYLNEYEGDKNSYSYIALHPSDVKSADTVTYDDSGNVIPLSERFNTKSDDIRYSSEVDSNNRQLTKAQQEYFKDSKVRDENGNLLVVYHGSESSFTEFDSNKTAVNGRLHGDGFYFTPSESKAKYWGGTRGYIPTVYEEYLNIENPYMADAGAPAPQDIINHLREGLGSIYDRLSKDERWFGSKLSKDEYISQMLNKSIDADGALYTIGFGNDITSALKELGYDGLIAKNKDGKIYEIVAYYPEQIKNTDNQNPTSNTDIRFSSEIKSGEEIREDYDRQTDVGRAENYPVRFSLEMAKRIEEKSMQKADALSKKGMLPYSMEYLQRQNAKINEAIRIATNELFNPKTGNVYTDKNGQPLIPEAVRLDEDGNVVNVRWKSATGGLSNNIFANGSYLKDAESTTECFRQLVYFAFAEKVSEKLGRPLTEREAIIANQAAIEIGVDAPCIYCYSLLDRKARESYKLQYLAERDAFMQQFEKDSGGDREAFRANAEKNFEKYYDAYVKRTLDPSAYDESGKKFKTRESSTTEARRENNHKKGQLSEKEKRVKLWMDLYASGADLLTENDVRKWSSDEELREQYKSIPDNGLRKLKNAEIDDLMSWVQGSSQAKIRSPYIAYSNVSRTGKAISGILTWPQATIDRLNSQFGLRFYSHADFHPAFTIDLMQQIRDASIRGLKGLMYCKPIEAAKICAPTGMNINVSCFAKYDENTGTYVSDSDMGADWAEVKKLRNEYNNVGSVMVVTSDDQLLWALTQDWIDVVIPLHKVRAGDVFMKEFGLNDYSRYQEDKLTDQEVYDRFVQDKIAAFEGNISETQKKNIIKDSKSIFPTEHQNDYRTYKEELAKRGLTARFNDILVQAESGLLYYYDTQITPQMYMKLVNETRQAAKDTSVLMPEFNIDEATAAVKSLKEKGYYDYFKPNAVIKGEVMNADQLADQVVSDIKAGKNANELGYGRRLNDDFLAGDPTAARAMALGLGGKHDVATRMSMEADEKYNEMRSTIRELREEIEKQIAKADYWKSQTRLTKDRPKISEASVDKFTRRVLKEYESNADFEETKNGITEYATWVRKNVSRINEDSFMDEAYAKAVDLMRPVVLNTTQVVNQDMIDTGKELRAYLKGGRGISLSEADKRAISTIGYDNYNQFRRQNFGKIKITDDGPRIDQIWSELQDYFGKDFFPDDIYETMDQLARLQEVFEELEPVYSNPFQYSPVDAEIAVDYAARNVLQRVLSNEVREVAPTYADKMHDRLEAEHKEAVEKVREAGKKAREQRDRKINDLKQHYRELNEEKRYLVHASADRDRLLKIARRMLNKKLPLVTKARIEELVGNLDLEAKSMTGETFKNLTELKEWYDEQKKSPDFIPMPDIEKKLARLEKRQIGTARQARAAEKGGFYFDGMTQEEVADLTEILLNIEHEIEYGRKLINDQDKRDVRAMMYDVLTDIKSATGINIGRGNAAYMAARNILVDQNLSPRSFFHRLTGYVDTDPLYRRYEELNDGQRNMLDYQMRASDLFTKWTEDKKFVEEHTGKKAALVTGTFGGQKVTMTRGQLVDLYMDTLNPDNMRHVTYGGKMFPNVDMFRKGNIDEAYAKAQKVRITPSEARAFFQNEGALTDKELAFVHKMQEYFSGMSHDEINKVCLDLYGYERALEDDYYPISVDTNNLQEDLTQIAEVGEKGEITLNPGFLQTRQKAVQPIYSRNAIDVLNDSIRKSSKFVGLAIPLRNFSKLYTAQTYTFEDKPSPNGDAWMLINDENLRETIEDKWGKNATAYIEKVLTDMQGKKVKSEKYEDVLNAARMIRSKYAGAVLTINPSVAMKQPASYPTAAAVLGWKPLIKAFSLPNEKVGKVDIGLIRKYTPLYWYRAQGFSNTELGEIASRGTKLPKALNWIQAMDLMTTRKLWRASEYWVRDNTNLETGTDSYYRAVASKYNEVIEQTQPNYTVMQRPGNLRAGFVTTSLMMFKTQPFQNFNVIYDAVGNYRAKLRQYKIAPEEKKASAKTALKEAQKTLFNSTSALAVSTALFSALAVIWGLGKRKYDEPKDAAKDFAKVVGSSVFGMVPFGSDVFEVAWAIIAKDKYWGYETVTSGALNDFMTSVYNVINRMANKGKAPTSTQILNMAKYLAQFMGIPIQNALNIINIGFAWAGEESFQKWIDKQIPKE